MSRGRWRLTLLALVLGGCGENPSFPLDDGGPPGELGACVPITHIVEALPQATLGESYEAPLVVEGGTPPFTFAVEGGEMPAGLLLLPSSGLITGVPSVVGTAEFMVSALDSCSGLPFTALVTLEVLPGGCPALRVSTTDLPPTLPDNAYSASLVASGGIPPYTWSLASGQLPPGLTLDPHGIISGTVLSQPTTYEFTIQATDSCLPPQQTTIDLTILIMGSPCPAVHVTTSSLPDASLGQPYSALLQAELGTPPYSWSLASGLLPLGLTLDGGSGRLSGTADQSGLFSITVMVQDTCSPPKTDTQALTLEVGQPLCPALTIATFQIPPATLGEPYTAVLEAQGGEPPYTWFLAQGLLPTGFTLDGGTGAISGNTLQAGVSSFTVAVRDSCLEPQTTERRLDLVVGCPEVVIETDDLPRGALGVEYRATLAAGGGIPPYEWAIATGRLPDGLALDAETGTIAGVPTVHENRIFTIQATDSCRPPTTVTKSMMLGIDDMPCPFVQITTLRLAEANEDEPYNQLLEAGGGTEPYRWEITSGALPAGLELDQGVGEIHGVATEFGSFEFTVTVTDSCTTPRQDRADYALNVRPVECPMMAMVPTIPQPVEQNAYFDHQLLTEGGTPPITWNLDSGELPSAITLNRSTGLLSGQALDRGVFLFTVSALDSCWNQRVATRNLQITVGRWLDSRPAIGDQSDDWLNYICQNGDNISRYSIRVQGLNPDWVDVVISTLGGDLIATDRLNCDPHGPMTGYDNDNLFLSYTEFLSCPTGGNAAIFNVNWFAPY